MATTACLTTTTAALSFGSSFCSVFSVATALADFSVVPDVDATMTAAITAVSGSSYCFSSAVMVPVLA